MPPRRNLVALKTRDTLTNLVDPHSTASASKSKAMGARPRKRTVVEDMPFPDFTPSSQVQSKPSSSSPPAKKRKPSAQKTVRRTSARSSSPLSSPSSPPRIATQTSLTLAASGSHKTSTTFVEDDEDDEPFASVFDILMGPPAGPSRSQTLEAKDEPEVPVFRPTTLPPGVEIGDAVYASRTKNFWPAVLTGFQPALTGEQKKLHGDRYDVEFQLPEFGKKSLRRKEVIFMTDEGIADCTLGVVKVEVIRRPTMDADEREDTPAVEDPDTQQAFAALDRRDQLILCRPHLANVIAESYEPARWRIDWFFDPRKKQKLRNQVMMGDILEHEVTGVIIPELQRWALRTPRPAGSERYEALSQADRRAYIDLVLLPEVVIHLCIRSIPADELRDTDQETPRDVHGASNDDAPAENPSSSARRLYDDARMFLKRLRETDTTLLWANHIENLKSARRRMRQRRGLESEDYDRVQSRQHKQMDQGTHFVGWTGRFKPVKGEHAARDASCNQKRWENGGTDVEPMR